MKSIIFTIIVISLSIVSNLTAAITQTGIVGVPDPSSAMQVYVLGDYAYVPVLEGLYTIDITDPANPDTVHFFAAPEPGWQTITFVDGWMYVTCTAGGLHVLSIADPAAPAYIGNYANGGQQRQAEDVDVIGDYAFVPYGNLGIVVTDVSDKTSDPGNIVYSTFDTYNPGAGSEVGIDVVGDYAYCAWAIVVFVSWI